MVNCKICGKEFENGRYLSAHLKFEEHIAGQNYYDTYIKRDNEGICEVCGKPTKYINFTRGYQKTCSQKCNNSNLGSKGKNISNTHRNFSSEQKAIIHEKRQNTCLSKYGVVNNLLTKSNLTKSHSSEARLKATNTRNKHILDGTINTTSIIKKSWKHRNQSIERFCKENDCTSIHELISIYGQGFLSLNLPRIYINKQNTAISNKYLPLIEEYYKSNQYSNKSKAEQYIIDHLEYDGNIKHNDRSIIRPKELDIYLPDLKLAIEYNGLYWHSIERGTDKYAHRNKSIACREKDIRLIHLFEFEDIDEQIYLINQLIQGNDLFNNNFSKNNLIENIPEDVEIIYHDNNYTIYGA